jgi:hypothetical protein
MSEPEPHPKPDYEVQAQIAAFAEERIEDFTGSQHVLNNIGSLALGGVEDVFRVTTRSEYRDDFKSKENKYGKVKEGTELAVATGTDYVEYLREVGGRRHEAIAIRAEMLGAYDTFKPVIESLKAELDDPANSKNHARHLGNGSNADVFAVTVEGADYAVRAPKGNGVKPANVDSHLGGAVLGKGMSHMEQIIAASYEDGVTVAEVMPGREVGHLTAEDVASVTDEQLEQLIGTVLEANERGIEIDPKPSNIFYDREQGFGIVDYHSSKNASKNSADQRPKDVLSCMAPVLSSMRLYGNGYNPDMTEADYAEKADIVAANGQLMRRFRDALETKLEGTDFLGEVLSQIDDRIASNDESVANYSSNEWVAEMIESDRERKRQQAKRAKTQDPTKFGGWDLV